MRYFVPKNEQVTGNCLQLLYERMHNGTKEIRKGRKKNDRKVM